MVIKTIDLKKKIIYRATYRGTKEMDVLLGTFVKKYINTFDDEELSYLSDLLDIDDETLYKFNQGENIIEVIEINTVTELFKSYVYKSD